MPTISFGYDEDDRPLMQRLHHRRVQAMAKRKLKLQRGAQK